ncbi:nuclear transport factor 2 family protein [Pseudomonadota bacterium]|nr:nuclear transport factor 2 family protein [Pseudomonadota bacterium]MDC0180205.1 nuclear transport factor 2 family protein [Pseudomonadota bacterium]|tara:strand:+ start:72 stop:488 length:417 start_codon:yes stop_codon:yes gene_type:complete
MIKDLVPSKLSNLYASIIDQRKFSSLNSIMWDDFSMLGQFEINGLENFITAMQQLENYQSTMHQVMNIQGEWEENLYKGETYCIASHMFDKDDKPYKLDMGIIYSDVIEIRDGTAKFLSRTFLLKWQKTDILDVPDEG